MTLNPKQERFCLEYLVDLNATQAAIRAGYSERSAKAIGHENLTKPDLAARVSELVGQRNERVKVDADSVLAWLAELAEVDIGDLYDKRGKLRALHELPQRVRRFVASIDYTKDGAKIRFLDRLRVLELIGKHVQVAAFRENVAVHSGDALVQQIYAARERARAATEEALH